MIHVCFGTQAELIKLAPILKELGGRGIPHRIIDTGQHPEQTRCLRKQFAMRAPDVCLHRGKSISSCAAAAVWGAKILGACLVNRRRLRREVFAPGPGCCVAHGDTLSTLLAAILAATLGLKPVHVESGLRSFRWLNPFPEEIVRVVTNRRADLLFAPGRWACENLRKMNVAGRVVLLPANTGRDALEMVLSLPASSAPPAEPYALASIHRYETIRSPRALARVVETVLAASLQARVLWPLHTVTRRAMARAGLLKELALSNVEMCDTLPYPDFARLLAGARFVIADGGSIQEESYFLDKPCLLLRHTTERREGLGENVLLSRWRADAIEEFLRGPQRYRRRDKLPKERSSSIVVEELIAFERSLHT